ncbi:MAG: hypothetical protein ABIB12_01540 [Patescibacteria group bacterium]
MRKQSGLEELRKLGKGCFLLLAGYLPSNVEVRVYCVKGESGKFCVKIVPTSHPFARNVTHGKTARLNAKGKVHIPEELAKTAELSTESKVLVTGGSHIEIWNPSNYDLEWKAILEAAGIEATP